MNNLSADYAEKADKRRRLPALANLPLSYLRNLRNLRMDTGNVAFRDQ